MLGRIENSALYNAHVENYSFVAGISTGADLLRVGLEQASDEVVAAHKAGRFSDCGRVADLCCGIGGDTLALAARAEVVACFARASVSLNLKRVLTTLFFSGPAAYLRA